MADSGSALEVLRELDEAGVCYFALTVKSKAARYKLVCTPCSLNPSA